ncbi:hypothetical protein PISMIDRAFT_275983 [Pisolithus microcarpus 441]|uniref:G domain-containing protein n=1 Tax=Pisolithus microcarpus 441 TaxID=765257 RepID=A0A0C9YQS8_9AGAM|nr:hypothetical protein PISMIDRAFT_275983 [Pisolithus microcarpus 441]
MSPSQVKHLFAHFSGGKGRSLLRSPITRAIDEVDGEASSFGGASSTLGNTTDCEAYENDRRTPPPRSKWNLSTLLDKLRLYFNAPKMTPVSVSTMKRLGNIRPRHRQSKKLRLAKTVSSLRALTCPTGSGKTTYIDHAVGNPDAGCGLTSSTKEVRTVQCPDSDGVRNIVLVDTPGCNNSFMTDSHVLVEIAWWLITV